MSVRLVSKAVFCLLLFAILMVSGWAADRAARHARESAAGGQPAAGSKAAAGREGAGGTDLRAAGRDAAGRDAAIVRFTPHSEFRSREYVKIRRAAPPQTEEDAGAAAVTE